MHGSLDNLYDYFLIAFIFITKTALSSPVWSKAQSTILQALNIIIRNSFILTDLAEKCQHHLQLHTEASFNLFLRVAKALFVSEGTNTCVLFNHALKRFKSVV